MYVMAIINTKFVTVVSSGRRWKGFGDPGGDTQGISILSVMFSFFQEI